MSAQASLLFVGLSPALGRVITLRQLTPRGVNRATGYLETAAGKATNGARVAVELGAVATLVTPLGEDNGCLFEKLANEDGIELESVSYAGRTRWAITLAEEDTSDGSGGATEIIVDEPTPLPPSVEPAVLEVIQRQIGAVDACVLAGTRPTGISDRLPARIAAVAGAAGVPLFLDMRGRDLVNALESLRRVLADSPELRLATQARPHSALGRSCVVKVNSEEFCDTLRLVVGADGRKPATSLVLDPQNLQWFADRFQCTILVTRGVDSTLYVDASGTVGEEPAVSVEARNPIGSGDTFLATLAVRLTEGYELAAAVREATQLAARNTRFLKPGTTIGP